MRCIVTGYAGFIGGHLTQKLLDLGHEVIGIDAFIAINSKKPKSHPKLTNIQYDFAEYDKNIEALFEGVDYVFHVGAQGSVPMSYAQPGLTFQRNFLSTINVLEMAKKNRCKRVIFSSSSSVYGKQDLVVKDETMTPNPQSPYAISKMICEYNCNFYYENFGLDFVALRYFNVYGPNQRYMGSNVPVIPQFVYNIGREFPCVFNGNGSTTRDFTYVDDVVDANILATVTAYPNQVYNVATGTETSLKDLHKMILDIIAPEDFKLGFGPTREGDVLHSKASTTKAKTMLGFEAKTNLKDGLKKYIHSALIN